MATRRPKKAKSEDPYEFIIDECLAAARGELFEALSQLDRVNARLVPEEFPLEVKSVDADWIPRAAQNGWVILTRDTRILKRKNELEALRASGAWAIILTVRRAGLHDLIEILTQALPRAIQTMDSFRKDKPLIMTVARGKPDVKLGHQRYPRKVIKKLRHLRNS